MGRDHLDRYYTPDALADAITGAVVREIGDVRQRAVVRVVEPSVGGGAFVRAVRGWLPRALVEGVDIDPHAPGLAACDERRLGNFGAGFRTFDHGAMIIGNPPFRGAEDHMRQALACAPLVCCLLRASILGSKKRRALWAEHPPRVVWQIVGRPSFTGGGTDSAEYVAVLWDRYHRGPAELRWLTWGDDAL